MSGHHHHGDGTAKALAVTLSVNVMLTLLKWTAFFFTGSSSLFAEAAHSTADTLNPIFLRIGFVRAKKPADSLHPQGYGKETFLWSMIAAQGMLLLGAGFSAYHGISALITGHAPSYSPIALGILAVALVSEGYSLFKSMQAMELGEDSLWATIRDTKNTVLLGVVFENTVDMLGLLLAITGFSLYLYTGNPVWDALFSLIIAGILTFSSVFLIRKSMSLLTGECGPDEVPEFVEGVVTGRGSAKVERVETLMLDAHHFSITVYVQWNDSWFVKKYHRRGTNIADMTEAGWAIKRLILETRMISEAIRERFPEATRVDIVIR